MLRAFARFLFPPRLLSNRRRGFVVNEFVGIFFLRAWRVFGEKEIVSGRRENRWRKVRKQKKLRRASTRSFERVNHSLTHDAISSSTRTSMCMTAMSVARIGEPGQCLLSLLGFSVSSSPFPPARRSRRSF
jgi:hypothetical protein